MATRNANPAEELPANSTALALAARVNAAVTYAKGACDGDGLEPRDALADPVGDGVRDWDAEATCVAVCELDCDGVAN